MRILVLFFLLVFYQNALSQEFKVASTEASLRDLPFGKIEKTLKKGESGKLTGIFSFWGKTESGWINLDYVDFTFPPYTKTGELILNYAVTGNGTVVFNFSNNKIRKNFFKKAKFSVVVLNRKVVLSNGNNRITLNAGTPILKSKEGFIYKNHFYTNLIFPENNHKVDVREILKKINRVIGIFNSAKMSSPLSERLGYFVKTFPLKESDVKVLKLSDGLALKINLKYQFFLKNGSPILDRKTRLFLKKSNYEFWKHVSEVAFRNGINRFVDIHVLRYDRNGSFEDCGFVVSSYHLFKKGMLGDWRSFLENSESSLDDDLWFFADRVYGRLEDD
jgi:hypothetical protein